MKLAPVACALCYAISMTITKITSDKDNVYTQMIHLYFGALLISLLFYIFTGEGQINNFTDPTFNLFFENGLQIRLMLGPTLQLWDVLGLLHFTLSSMHIV
jgi:hypothetical protein